MEIVTKKVNLKSGVNYYMYRMFLFLSIYNLGINKRSIGQFTMEKHNERTFTIENSDITLYFDIETLTLIRRYMWVPSVNRTGWYYRRIEKFEKLIREMNQKFLKLKMTPWKFRDEFLIPLVTDSHAFADVYIPIRYTFDMKYCDACLEFGENVYITIDGDGIVVQIPYYKRTIEREVKDLLKGFFKWK